MAIGADRLADAFERAPTLIARLAGLVSPQDAPETVIAKAREVIAVITVGPDVRCSMRSAMANKPPSASIARTVPR